MKWMIFSVLSIALFRAGSTEEAYVDVLGDNVDHHRPPEYSKKRWCHRDWPTTNGTWMEQAPYWQSSPDCPNRVFDEKMTAACLKGRTIYAMGNSIGRQAVYGVLEMLGGASVKRENQRDACPKHETTWDDSCHDVYEGVKLKYLFMQYMDGFDYGPSMGRDGFPFYSEEKRLHNGTKSYEFIGRKKDPKTGEWATKPNSFSGSAGEYWEDDNCIKQVTRNCFRRFFKDATRDDIFIFTLGASYLPNSDFARTVDHNEWLRVSAINFRNHIAATFPGQVFHVVLAQPNIHAQYGYLLQHFSRLNRFLWKEGAWNTDRAGCSSEDRPWYTIDQWAINEGRYHLYNDHLHFNGKLTHATIHQVLNEMCPPGFDQNEGDKKKEKKKDKKRAYRSLRPT